MSKIFDIEHLKTSLSPNQPQTVAELQAFNNAVEAELDKRISLLKTYINGNMLLNPDAIGKIKAAEMEVRHIRCIADEIAGFWGNSIPALKNTTIPMVQNKLRIFEQIASSLHNIAGESP